MRTWSVSTRLLEAQPLGDPSPCAPRAWDEKGPDSASDEPPFGRVREKTLDAKKPLSASTLSNILSLLRRVIGLAVEDG